jgi:hypothetical protein
MSAPQHTHHHPFNSPSTNNNNNNNHTNTPGNTNDPDPAQKSGPVYPSGWTKKMPPHLRGDKMRPQKFNSTSSLYIDSTITKPKNAELIHCIALYLEEQMKPQSEETDKQRSLFEIFDEAKYPLTASQTDTTNIPDEDTMEKHVKNVFKIGQLAHESLVMAVAYLKRIREHCEFVLYPSNWKRMTLSCLILASKVWEDQAVWNVDFLDLFPLATPFDLGQMEKKMLGLLGFDVSLKASEYAKIYFDLRSHCSEEQFDELKPLDQEGEEKLELRTKNYTEKHAARNAIARPQRSTGSMDDISHLRSPRVILS